MRILEFRPGFKKKLRVIAILFVIAISYTLNALTVSKEVANCRIDSCITSVKLEKLLTRRDLNESILFSFSITDKSRLENELNIYHQGAIQLLQDNSRRFLLLPMRVGTSKYFKIAFPKMHKSDMTITIKIINSQSFYIYIDKALIYSHRYQLPVFYVSDFSYLHTQLNDKVSTFTDVHFSLYEQKSAIRDLQLFEFIFLAIVFGAVVERNFVQPLKHVRRKGIPYSYWPLWPIIILWTTRLFMWGFSPRDPTGVTSLTPFGPSGPFFSDIFQVIQVGQTNRPYDLQASTYPPFINAFAKLFYFAPPTFLVFGLLIATSVFWARSFRIALALLGPKMKVVWYVTCIFSLPVLFGLFRGNLDLLVSGLIGVGTMAILRNKPKSAIIPLGLAVSLKYWPALIVLFFVRKIGWRIVLQIAALSIGLSIASAIFIGYQKLSEILHVILIPVIYYSDTNSTNQLQYSYSLKALLFFGGIGLKAENFLHPTKQEINLAAHLVSSTIQITLALIVIAALLFLAFKSLKVSSILLFGGAASLLVTGTSYTYRASVLVIVLLVRIFEIQNFPQRLAVQHEGVTLKKVLKLIEGLAWLGILAPIDFIYGENSAVSVESLFQPLALIFLCIVEGIFVFQENTMPAPTIKLRLKSMGLTVSNWKKIK